MGENGKPDFQPMEFHLFNQSKRCGILSYNVLLDKFKPVNVLYAPVSCQKWFSWYIPVAGTTDYPLADVEGSVLYLCHPENAIKLLEKNSSCFCLVVSKDLSDCSFIEDKKYCSRVLVFKEEERFYFYSTLLYTIFTNELLWLQEMDHMVYRNRTLVDLINFAATMMDNFICITDTGYNLITASSTVSPQLDEHKNLLDKRCLSADAIDYLQQKILPQSRGAHTIVIAEPNERRSFPILHCPIYIDGMYLFHIAMECANGSFMALYDQFSAFSERAVTVASSFWRNTANLEAPWHRLLISLMEGEQLSDDYMCVQLSMTKIPKARQFRLLQYVFPKEMDNQKRNKIIRSATDINNKQCYVFMYENRLFVLMYSKAEKESELCSAVVNATTSDHVFERFGLIAGSSELFMHIRDIRFAYNQTNIALDYLKVFQREHNMVWGTERFPVVPFEHVLKYYLIQGNCDQSLVEHSFKNCILSKIQQLDRKEGTEIARLLWVYLTCDRNATEAAKRVHIHRNTVLYHIKRIEVQFGLDFRDPFLKERISLDYCQMILRDLI